MSTLYGTGPILPGDIRSLPFLGRPGALLSGESWSLVNAESGVAEEWTITAGGATNSTTYTVTLLDANGVSITSASYTSDGSATTAEITAGLLAAIKANALFGAFVTPAATSSTVTTLVGTQKGRAFSLTSSSSDVVVAQSVAATDGTNIGFGLGVVQSLLGGSRLGRLPYGHLTAKVGTVTMAYAANTIYTVTVSLYPNQRDPIVYSASTVADTNLATTKAALIAALNGQLPANSVDVAAAATATFTLTAEIAGLDFEVSVNVSSGTGTLAFAWTTATAATNLDNVFGGVTVRRADVTSLGLVDQTAAYPPGRAMGVGYDDARVVVPDQSQTIAFRDAVYVGVGSANNGVLYNASGANRVRLNPARYWWEQQADGLAVVFVDVE